MFRFVNDKITAGIAATCAASATIVLGLIVAFLLSESQPAWQAVGFSRFFSDASWHPEPTAVDGLFGIIAMVVGTGVTTLAALLLAIPIGILAAIYGEFYASRFVGQLLKRVIELLAGIPSVVYGLWGLVVLVPIIQAYRSPGVSILAGAIVLAVMILPTIALTSSAAIAAVSDENKTNAAALGMHRAAVIWSVVLPLSRPGIVVGILLAMARAIGETMVVVMVCGNVAGVPESVFDSVRTLTATIALEMGYSFGAHRATLFFIGLLLVGGVLTLLSLIHAVQPRREHA